VAIRVLPLHVSLNLAAVPLSAAGAPCERACAQVGAERRKAADLQEAAGDLLEKHAALEKALQEEQVPLDVICGREIRVMPCLPWCIMR
jgi:hypothetical protein